MTRVVAFLFTLTYFNMIFPIKWIYKRFVFTAILAISSSGKIYCQNNHVIYFPLIQEAKCYYSLKEYTLACNKIEQAFKLDIYHSNADIKLAIKAAKKCNNDSLRAYYSQLLLNNKKSVNSDTKRQIDRLFKADQKVRKPKYIRASKLIHNTTSSNQSEFKYQKSKDLYQKWRQTDSINALSILEITAEVGFLHKDLVGRTRAIKAYLILLHFDEDSNNLVLGKSLDIWLKQGLMTPEQYARIFDRRLVDVLNKAPKYYYQPWGLNKLNDRQLEQVNSARREIGLPDLFAFRKFKGTNLKDTKCECPANQETQKLEWEKVKSYH